MKPTVLVIDDDRMIRQILSDLLADAGFHVILAASGKEGCRLAVETLPDVILIDLMMPEWDGVTVCRYLHTHGAFSQTALILMTAFQNEEMTVNPFQVGADDYVTKPFDRSELIARIRGNLQKKQHIYINSCKARNYDALLEISETVTSAVDAEIALKEIVRKISEHLDAVDRCSIALIREQDGCGNVLATTADLLRPAFRIDLHAYPEIQQVMKTGRPLLLEDLPHNPLMTELLPVLEDRNINAIMVFPVIHDQMVAGVLIIRIARPGEGIVKADVDFCQLVSTIVVAALKSTNFFDLVWEETENLRSANEQLEHDLNIKAVYEDLFDKASEGLIAFDSAERIVYANQCLLDMVECERGKIRDKTLTDLFGLNVSDVLRSYLNVGGAQKGNNGRFDLSFTNESGIQRIFSVSIAGEPVRGELRVAALRDVTKTRKMETELLRTQAMLEQSNAELVKADQARTEFLNIATHELRIPLAVANGYCTLLAESDQSKLSEQQQDYIQQAIAASERLSDLIDNLLDLSRLDSGRMALDLRPCDPVQTVEEFLGDYENLIDNKQFHFESRLPLNCMALFDPEKIYRVLVNLLSNAVKFTETGGKISIILHDADDRVLFSIEDNGKGIAAEHIPLLFEAFSQVGKQENRTGSGLGLYICRKIVEAHQGRIWAESQVGSGSKFLFSLPKAS